MFHNKGVMGVRKVDQAQHPDAANHGYKPCSHGNTRGRRWHRASNPPLQDRRGILPPIRTDLTPARRGSYGRPTGLSNAYESTVIATAATLAIHRCLELCSMSPNQSSASARHKRAPWEGNAPSYTAHGRPDTPCTSSARRAPAAAPSTMPYTAGPQELCPTPCAPQSRM
jgi:hypothetical protein